MLMDHSIRSACISLLLEKGTSYQESALVEADKIYVTFYSTNFVRCPFLNYMEHAQYLSSVCIIRCRPSSFV